MIPEHALRLLVPSHHATKYWGESARTAELECCNSRNAFLLPHEVVVQNTHSSRRS